MECDRQFLKAHGRYEGTIGDCVGESEDKYSDEDQDDSLDNAESDHMSVTHYLFQLRCILYRRRSQLHDPNDPDGPKIRTETDQDRMVRDNLLALLRSHGAESVTSSTLEFYHSLGTRTFPLAKQVSRTSFPNTDQNQPSLISRRLRRDESA